MMTSSIFATSIMIFLVIFGEQIVRLWTGSMIHISIGLLVIYGLWSIIDAVGNAFGVFLNGCGLLRPQIITMLFFCTAGIVAKVLLIRLFGIEAMIFGAVLSYIFISSVVYGLIFRRELIKELK
jgi:O-antigen/teichoic acid export membrane protein